MDYKSAGVDIEAGYQFSGTRFTGSANLYMMEYKDMLLETGRLSSSGYAIKENVGRGWRRGIELAAAWMPFPWARIDGNLTLSTNKLRLFTAYLEDWVEGGYRTQTYENTTMLLSPSVVGMGRVETDDARPEREIRRKAVLGQYPGRNPLHSFLLRDGPVALAPFRPAVRPDGGQPVREQLAEPGLLCLRLGLFGLAGTCGLGRKRAGSAVCGSRSISAGSPECNG